MTLPSSSQCCRAVRHRLRPQHDSIWVPDSFLALDHYCATLRNGARNGSSVPGPMENRRRLGKRHMGELNFGPSHSAAPLWDFASLVDLTQWQWKPPISPNSILQHHGKPTQELKPNTLWENLGQALFSGSSTHASSSDTQSSNGEILSQDAVLSGVAEYQALPIPVWDAQSTPSDVVNVGLNLLLSDLQTPLATVVSMPNLANFCSSWRNGLRDGLFNGEAIRLVLRGIMKGLDAENPVTSRPLTLENVKIHIYNATIEGICGQERQGPAQFDHAVWSDMLQHTSELRLNNIRIFTKVLDCIPAGELDKMSPGIVANLITQIIGLGRAKKRASLPRQAAKIAMILERLEFDRRRDILDAVTRRLSLYAGAREINFAWSRLSWLHVLARLPGRNKELAQACRFLESNPASERLSRTEICHLFLARLNSRDAAQEITHLYNHFNRPRIVDLLSFHRLSRGFWITRQYGHAKSMFRFLHQLGREYGVLQLAKGVRNSVTGDITSLANMAIGMRIPSVAIQIFSLFDESGRRPEQFWKSTSASEALKSLVNARSLNPRKFLKTLNVVPISHGKRGVRRRRNWDTPVTPLLNATATRRYLKSTLNSTPKSILRAILKSNLRSTLKSTLSLKQVLKTTRAAMALARTSTLTRRKALALISETVKHLKSYDLSLPPNVMRAIIYNVTRDLAEGRPGRNLRLRWLLHLLRGEFGEREMLRTGMSLKRWRDFNFRRRSRARSGRYATWSQYTYGRGRMP
ncbi:hypothetical protein F5X99DRAFT_336119 [Biscogniauxia marginata]|nr:hypothetical protein F5X99DRAFT_336119 [Biscogniauxia marginata]